MGGTLTVWRGDITTMEVDAVVNAANEGLKGGGGVDGAIHRAAGPGLMEECRRIGGCETGQSVVTDAYDLPARYVIHTVGPVWRGGAAGEAELLASCYRTALQKAMDRGCDSVAVPAISTGVYGYPEAQAAAIAVRTVREVQAARDDAPDVTLVAYSKGAEAVLRAALAETGG